MSSPLNAVCVRVVEVLGHSYLLQPLSFLSPPSPADTQFTYADQDEAEEELQEGNSILFDGLWRFRNWYA